ncbi:hypothetical protein D3C87_76510 [compost metagenome]
MKNMKNVPLIKQKYIYVGKDNDCHKNGKTYVVIDTGYHWIKEYGFVVWMTYEDCTRTDDIDLGISMDLGYFNSSFWKP